MPGAAHLADTASQPARLRGEVSADAAHPVEALRPDGDAAAACPITIGEAAVGIEHQRVMHGVSLQLIGSVLAGHRG